MTEDIPALLIMKSIALYVSMVASIHLFIEALSVTSKRKGIHSPPLVIISDETLLTSCWFTSVAITFTPSAAKTLAVASPIPLPAPEMIATLPLTDLESFLKIFIFKIFELFDYL